MIHFEAQPALKIIFSHSHHAIPRTDLQTTHSQVDFYPTTCKRQTRAAGAMSIRHRTRHRRTNSTAHIPRRSHKCACRGHFSYLRSTALHNDCRQHRCRHQSLGISRHATLLCSQIHHENASRGRKSAQNRLDDVELGTSRHEKRFLHAHFCC